MTVELISVGTEILLGNIVNTNAAYLAEKCAQLGITCYYQTVVGDNAERIKMTLEAAASRSDLIIMSGGLGPTEDDLTKEVASEFAGKKLLLDKRSLERIKSYFEAKGITPTENNRKQAMIPEGAEIFDSRTCQQ